LPVSEKLEPAYLNPDIEVVINVLKSAFLNQAVISLRKMKSTNRAGLTERPKVRSCRLRQLQKALFLGAATTTSKPNKEAKKDQDLDNISKDALKKTQIHRH
jgi:hypothetical protein